ncbi:MAG: hypothetical protein AB8F74_19500, partial [Saprospiraceae bacterium]
SDSLVVKVLLGKYLANDSIKVVTQQMIDGGAGRTKIDFLQDTESRKAIENLKSTQANYLKVVENSKDNQRQKDETISKLNAKIDSLMANELLYRKVAKEVKVLFPDLTAISLADNAFVADLADDKQISIPVLHLEWHEKLKSPRQKKNLLEKEQMLIDWVKVRAEIDTLKVTH